MTDPRTAFFLPDLNGGGAERAALLLAAHWPSAHPAVVVVRSPRGPLEALAERLGVEVVELGLARVSAAATARTPARLARVVRERGIDVVVASLAMQSVVAARVLVPRLAVVWSVQNPLGTTAVAATERTRTRLRAAAVGGLHRLSVRGLDAVVVPAAGLRATLPAAVAGRPVVTVPNPLDPALLAREPADHVDVDRVVAAGRLVPQKRFDVLLHAVARVAETRAITCDVFGEGPMRADLEALARRLGIAGRVSFRGFVDDVAAIYRGAGAFALTSDFEGFGNVVVEALASGAAVVSTDAPYGPREILDGGRYGLLVPRDDPDAFAGALMRALPGGADHDRLRAAARGRAMTYAPAALAAALHRLTVEVVERRDAGGRRRSRSAVR